MTRLAGKVALITGGASGIGRAISVEFARQGARIFIVDRDAGAVEEAMRIVSEFGEPTGIAGDVTCPEDVAKALTSVEKASGKLHVLVNSAGITQRADFRHLKDTEWQEILDINLSGTMRFSRDAIDLMRAGEGASIINLSSVMGGRHIRQLSAYSTTKAAVAALSRSMAVEYASFNIRVNYLCPGYVETALTERILRNPAIRDGLLQRTPMARFGQPDDVAKAALFLASDESAYITGAGLNIDGGMSVAL